MGRDAFSYAVYDDRAKMRAATGTPVFLHDHDIKSGKTKAAVHAKLNPFKVTRESRDSDLHPTSLAIGAFIDETGSMGVTAAALQKKLASLMNLLIGKGYVLHPHILFGAIGDANSDQAPLQVGQFESGIAMEDDLSLIFLEGNGGGQHHETYELAHYFMARHTSIDCFEKRGRKGYLFTMGDEAPYERIRKSQVHELMGDTLEADLKTKDVFAEAAEKYEIFHIIVQEGSYPHDPVIERAWKDLLGERVLSLDDVENVVELIATTIALTEGAVDMDGASHALASVGTSAAAIDSVTKSLATYAGTRTVQTTGTASATPDGDVHVTRI